MKKKCKRGFPPVVGTKLLRIMKLTIVLSIIFCLQATASGYSQDKKLSLEVKESSLEKVFEKLEQLSEYRFIYFSPDMKNQAKLSASYTDADIHEILDMCLENTGLTYKIMDEHIIINPQASTLQDEKRTIRGNVTDDDGEPIPGVNIILLEYNNGTITDENGNYSLSIPDGQCTLRFSFIGFVNQEISVERQTEINVVLVAEVSQIDDVVVNGYFSKSKNSLTGNAIVVKAEELQKVSSGNILQAVQIFDPSFVIAEANDMGSNPNNLPDIKMRGGSTLTGEGLDESQLRNNPNLPTFILDGYEVGVQVIYDLDIDRIENVTILKDAAATAIYGSRAANGVMVIQTKNPEIGELKWDYSSTLTFTTPDLTDYNLCNASEKLEAEQLGGYYSSSYYDANLLNDIDYQNRLDEVRRGVDTYWLSQPLQTAFGQKHNLRASGGDKAVRYDASASIDKNPGVMKDSKRDRFALAFKLSYNLKDKFLFRNQIEIQKVNAAESPYGNYSEFGLANPYYRTHDENGNLITTFSEEANRVGIVRNPLYEGSLNMVNENEFIDVRNSTSFDYFATENLRIKGQFAIGEKRGSSNSFISPFSARYMTYDYTSGEGSTIRGEASKMDQVINTLDANVVIQYNNQWGKSFLNAVAGGNIKEDKFRSTSFSVQGFANETLDYISLGKEYMGDSPAGSEGKNRLLGGFGNLNYGFDNRYTIDLSYRIDGSSAFGNDKRYAPFWSTGFGYNLHNEKFWFGGKAVNYLRLAVNTGQLGKSNFSPYQSRQTYQYNMRQWYSYSIGAQLMGLGNSNLEWEKTQSTDFSFRADLFNSTIKLQGNYYVKNTKGMVAPITLPLSNGFTTYTDNIGELQNVGYELSISGLFKKGRDFSGSVNVALSHNTNEIKKISNSLRSFNQKVKDQQNEDAGQSKTKVPFGSKPRIQYEEGQSISAIYAVRSLGINPMNGREVFLTADGDLTYNWNANDIEVVGDTEPDLRGSISSFLSYKNWDLNVAAFFELGGQRYNSTLVDRVENANLRYNVDKRYVTDRWKEPGDIAQFKNISDHSKSEASSRFVQDYNMIQLQSVSLSYSVNREWLKKISFDRARFTLMMNDLVHVSTVKRERGIQYPYARSVNLKVQLIF